MLADDILIPPCLPILPTNVRIVRGPKKSMAIAVIVVKKSFRTITKKMQKDCEFVVGFVISLR